MITKEEQDRIIQTICHSARGLPKRKILIHGAVIALGEEAPPFWLVNVMCGREDRMFENVKEEEQEEDDVEDEENEEEEPPTRVKVKNRNKLLS